MRKLSLTTALAAMFMTTGAFAADPVAPVNDDIPAPPEMSAERGIWGAIAYSSTDKKYGIFWGGDTRQEAGDIAMKHCANAEGASCRLVEVYRNHRHKTDDDGAGPYNYCAVLAVDSDSDRWGSATARSIKAASDDALAKCNASSCEIVQRGCT